MKWWAAALGLSAIAATTPRPHCDIAKVLTPGERYIGLLDTLALKRNALDTDHLREIAASRKPLNPVSGDKGTLGDIDAHVYEGAFDSVVAEGIPQAEWKTIRQHARALAKERAQGTERRDEARRDTSWIFKPVPEMKKLLPRLADQSASHLQSLIAPDGSLAFAYYSHLASDHGLRVATADPKSGKITDHPIVNRPNISTAAVGQLLQTPAGEIVAPFFDNKRVLIADVRTGKTISEIDLGTVRSLRPQLEELNEAPRLTPYLMAEGNVAAVVEIDRHPFLVDPLTKRVTPTKVPDGETNYFPSRDGKSVFALTVTAAPLPRFALLTELPSGKVVRREPLTKEPKGMRASGWGPSHFLEEAADGKIRFAVRDADWVYVFDSDSKTPPHVVDSPRNANSPFLGFTQKRDGTPLFVTEPIADGIAAIDLARDTLVRHPLAVRPRPQASLTQSPLGEALVVTTHERGTTGQDEIVMTNLEDGQSISLAGPGLGDVVGLHRTFVTPDGQIKGLLWTRGSLSLVRLYGPR